MYVSKSQNIPIFHAPNIHVFHTQHDISSVVLEGSVEGHNTRTIAVVTDLEFSQNLLSDLFIGIDTNNLAAYQQRSPAREVG